MSSARELDQFYTKAAVAVNCIHFLANYIDTKGAYFVEPSAGAGAFWSQLPDADRLGLDLDPKHEQIRKADFLKFDPQKELPSGRVIVTIGNPPFGKNSSLALKFVNRAAEFSDVVAFVLPMTFKKESMKAKLARNLHLVAEVDLNPYSFEFEGADYDVPCVFQVYERRATLREVTLGDLTHSDFEFCTPATADFAIRRVGGLAGKVISDFSSYSPASHYYIKAKAPGCKAIFEGLCWDDVKHNTAGNPSISKRELVRGYATALSA